MNLGFFYEFSVVYINMLNSIEPSINPCVTPHVIILISPSDPSVARVMSVIFSKIDHSQSKMQLGVFLILMLLTI